MTQDHPLQKLKNIYHKLRSAMARMKYKNPQKDLTIIGVTGTDGKTTVTSMIYHVLNFAGLPVGYISTINAKIGNNEMNTGLHVTTPDPWVVPEYLSIMKKEGAKYVVMESTSNGLEQGRLDGIAFDSAVITNIKYDHLDYHGTWENYAASKFLLIKKIKDNGLAVLNQDDEKSAEFIKEGSNQLKQNIYAKWCSKFDVENYSHTIEGLRFTYEDTEFHIPIIGEHNLLNALQVINICLRYTDIETIKMALKVFETPEGRMQVMQSEPFAVVVDFAHTPQALESALNSIRTIVNEDSRIISIFGCAGRRDKGRRGMGEVSARLADITILGPEDPRNEKVHDINNDILENAKKAEGKLIFRFESTEDYEQTHLDHLKKSIDKTLELNESPVIAFDADDVSSRHDAIDLAIKLARPNDLIFITGKGHEKSLAFGKNEIEYSWSDQEEVLKIIQKDLRKV